MYSKQYDNQHIRCNFDTIHKSQVSFMLSVIMLSVVMLSVVAQYIQLGFSPIFKFGMEQHIFDIEGTTEKVHKFNTPVACTINVLRSYFFYHIDSGQYYKTTITIVFDDPS